MGTRRANPQLADDSEALRRQIAKLQARYDELVAIYRSAPVGLCRQDTELRYLYINEWLARINGLPVEDHIGEDMREILPQVAAGVLHQMRPVFETGEPAINITNHVETAAHPGVRRLYQYSFFPVKSADGSVVAVDCVVADITDVFEGYVRDISRHEATEDLRSRFVQQVVTAQDRERRRIADDLHDGVCQMISAARLRLESIVSDGDAKDLSVVSEILRQSIDDIRAISHNLHSPVLDDLGIVAAIRKVCQELTDAGSCRVEFECDADSAVLPRDMQNHLFRLVQEALQNAARHSGGDRIVVTVTCSESALEVRIEDNGVGFSAKDHWAASTGSGIMNMKERARFLEAELTIQSAPSGGTHICVRVPRPECC